jgi:hypothetical protein
MLRKVDLYLFADVSGQSISPIFNGQAVPKECQGQVAIWGRAGQYAALEESTKEVFAALGRLNIFSNNQPL